MTKLWPGPPLQLRSPTGPARLQVNGRVQHGAGELGGMIKVNVEHGPVYRVVQGQGALQSLQVDTVPGQVLM